MRAEITLPLPPRVLSPNNKAHYMTIARARKDYLWACLQAIQEQKPPRLCGRVTVHYEFYQWKGQTSAEKFARSAFYFGLDPDNCLAAAKMALDALAHCGVIQGDSARYIRLGSVTLRRTEKEHGRQTKLVLTLETEEENAAL